MVVCAKLNEELPALSEPPLPGDVGKRIQQHISAKAWDMWLAHQTMLINEYKLSLIESSARKFLSEEREKFLFGSGSEKPKGYTPEEDNS